jgi:pilus assembly protein Flp/PilA
MSMISKISAFVREEEGLTIVEYAVAGSLVTVGAVAAFVILGNNVCGVITSLGDAIMGTETPVAACA